jgi:beta-lactamase regulating signal transducer with metallopeptidase domain
VVTPLVWGFLDPIIVLPESAHHWPAEQRRMVLLHELAHIRRGDALVQVLAAVARALYWFHPALIWCVRELRSSREEACDALVLSAGVKRSDYASCLMEIARVAAQGSLLSRTTTTSALAMAQPGGLERRVKQVLAWLPRREQGRRVRVMAIAACAIWICAMGTVRLAPKRAVVVAALSSNDWATRGYAARLLTNTREPAIRAALDERAAHDPSAVVRRIASYRGQVIR